MHQQSSTLLPCSVGSGETLSTIDLKCDYFFQIWVELPYCFFPFFYVILEDFFTVFSLPVVVSVLLPSLLASTVLLCREGLVDEALHILHSMDFSREIPVDTQIYHILLDCCTVQKLLKEGKQVHTHMRITGAHQNPYLAAKLLYLYSTCGSIVDVRATFDEASEWTMFMWNALLRAYVKNGFCETDAMDIYNQMKLSGTELDNFTFSIMLKACRSLMDLQ